MLPHFKKSAHQRPWSVGLAVGAALIELILALLWLADRSRDWAEPALVVIGILFVILGIPSLRDLLGKPEDEVVHQEVERRESEDRVRHVCDAYLHLTTEFPPQTAGLNGLVRAGVYLLRSDSEIRAAIKCVEGHGAQTPLGSWSDRLSRKDLFCFFKQAEARNFDFVSVGNPSEILASCKCMETETAPNSGPQADG